MGEKRKQERGRGSGSRTREEGRTAVPFPNGTKEDFPPMIRRLGLLEDFVC